MTTDYKVTELFYIIDEFCKHFDAEELGLSVQNISAEEIKLLQKALYLVDC